jgi:hypothetical protein
MDVFQIQVLRAWTGGPLRQFTATKVSSAFVPFAITSNGCSFAGRYVCDGCQQPHDRVIDRRRDIAVDRSHVRASRCQM